MQWPLAGTTPLLLLVRKRDLAVVHKQRESFHVALALHNFSAKRQDLADEKDYNIDSIIASKHELASTTSSEPSLIMVFLTVSVGSDDVQITLWPKAFAIGMAANAGDLFPSCSKNTKCSSDLEATTF